VLTLVAAGALGVRLLACAAIVQTPAAQEVIAAIQVHGNHISTDDEVVQIAGLAIGAPFGASTIADAASRLKASKKFQEVTVLKRFASIADASQIVVVVIVDEGPMRIELPDTPGGQVQVVKRRGFHNLMFMPILVGEDGYGLTYGVRIARPGVIGERSRLSFPLTLGGTQKAGAELDRTFVGGPLTRVEVGGALQSVHNPGFDADDNRRRVWGRAEKAFGVVRFAGDTEWQHVSFLGEQDHVTSFGGEATLDTRIDPVLPRNAVFARASIDHYYVDNTPSFNRWRLESEGDIGLFGQMVLVLRAERQAADAPLPFYLKPLLGGNSNLRGFEAGSFIGDVVVNGSLEIRIPLTSPLEIGKLGVSVFADTGKAYAYGERFKDQPYHTGVGGSVWMAATAFRMSLAVAHGLGASTRVNFGVGITF
jgi:outer membrane protein assembly factor BamA